MASVDTARTGRMPTPTPSSAGGTGSTPAAPAASVPLPPASASPVAQDTFRRLAPDVTSGKLPAGDARMLAEQSARRGVIGEAQAISAARRAAALPDGERARFQQALAGAGSDTEKAFIYKALAAGHSVDEVEGFARSIRNAGDEELIRGYTLSDPLGDDRLQLGLKQQFGDSCVPTVAQTLHGDSDPIYAQQVRSQNADPHKVGTLNGQNPNLAVAGEQKRLLEEVGYGHAVPDGLPGGAGTKRARIDEVLNSVSQQTGVHYQSQELAVNDRWPEKQEPMLDQMASQLRQGIATPFEIRTPDDRIGHEALAIAVEGEGENQRFLVHDPGTGDTAWLDRKELELGTDRFDGWKQLKLASFARAEEQLPAPAAGGR